MTDGVNATQWNSERRALQIAIAIGALVPLSAGGAGVFLGPRFVEAAVNVSADSHFRYLSGILFAIGLAFCWMIPTIEARTSEVRLLTFAVFVGGLARLLALFTIGVPSGGMIFGLVMELVVTPAFCLWQSRVARASAASR